MFFNKIKSKYQQNLIEKLIAEEEFDDVKKILDDLLNGDWEKNELLINNTLTQLLNKESCRKVFNNNLIWINSFEKIDCSYINTFVEYIFKKNEIHHTPPSTYQDYLIKIFNKDISFDKIVSRSYIFQYLISQLSADPILINSSGAFFEAPQQKYFTHYFLTKFYIYIVRDPETIYRRRKHMNPSMSFDERIHGMTSSNTNYIESQSYNTVSIEENIQNWSINVSSWVNANVISTFKGYILKYERLLEDPHQVLSEIVAHMIQSGIDISLNYSEISTFIDQHKPEQERFNDVEISNRELKVLKRDNAPVAKAFKYLD